MRAYRDALDRAGIPWADATDDTGDIGGYRLHIERTETWVGEDCCSVIWGYQALPGRDPVGTTFGWPGSLECWYPRGGPAEPRAMDIGEIMEEVFGR